MDHQPNSPYVYAKDVSEPAGPYVSHDEVEETDVPDPEGRDVVIADGEAMSYRAYHRR
ncbi:hypothetical protein [Halobellus clavatus]|jgi:hypothetical protein|uniref:Uncharacterized protein n=1 Tax=Halobellus clavatus TaxID=660517 RepID=A0A1H3IRN0_9EURY|nr:hypothetical protein [Halobellus clavatus]SDY29975.1 hypothetical protein SAMN04487946_110133 [Halobellus clavatus]